MLESLHNDVVDVDPVMPMALQAWFSDDTMGHVRFVPSHLTGLFKALKDPKMFGQARIEAGTVTWASNFDLAPDVVYAEIKSRGEWILR